MTGFVKIHRFEFALLFCACLCWGIGCLIWKFTPTTERTSIPHKGLTIVGSKYYWPDHDMPIYVSVCLVSLAVTTAIGYLVLRRYGFPAPKRALESSAISPRLSFLDLAVILFLFAVIWIPNANLFIEKTYQRDQFHHLNYYLFSPLHSFQHGAALGTEAFTQYQSGWILLFAALGNFTTVDHPLVIQVFSLFTALYFSAWYFVLRKLGFNSIWAALCILVCLMLQHFLVFQREVNYTLWCFPSSTICRNPTDVFVLGSLLYLFEKNQLRYALSAGCFVGLGLLFGNDTGLYVTLATLGACLLRLLDRRLNRRQSLSQLIALILAAVVVALSGLAIASRGTLLQANFWSGYYEAVLVYSTGFSSLPIRGFLGLDLSVLFWAILFLATLVIYTVAIARATVLTLNGRASRLEPLLAFIGIVGFGTLILFINRSHPSNLTHVIVPAIVLWFAELLRFFAGENDRQLGQPSTAANRWGILLGTICLGVMFFRANFRSHPSLLNTWTGNFSGEAPTQEYQNTLKLLPQLKQEIEKRLGPQPYALVGEDTTLWLMAFDQQSPTRYLPMLVVTRAQEEIMAKELNEQNLIFCKQQEYLSGDDLRQMLERKYSLIESKPYYDIYRRSDLPPLELKSLDIDESK